MSLNTFFSFLLSISLFVWSILLETDKPGVYWHIQGFILVVGGTMASTFLAQETRYVIFALRGILEMFTVYRGGRNALNQDIGRIIRWGYLVQQKGLPALESEVAKAKGDTFLTFGVELLLTGYTSGEVRDTLENVAYTTYERNMVPVNILKGMAGTAPAFGMIGTLVGMIGMLQSMGNDASKVGTGMATALTATLYALLSARFFFMPAAMKLSQRHSMTRFRQLLLAEGFAYLADRRNPRHIQDRLNSFLDPNIHFNIDKQLKN